MGFDLVTKDEVGAGGVAWGLVELVAKGGECLGAPWGGERVEADEQFAVAGDDVAGAREGFADEGVGFVAGAGVVAVQRLACSSGLNPSVGVIWLTRAANSLILATSIASSVVRVT